MKRFLCKHVYLLLIPMLLSIAPFTVCLVLLNSHDPSDAHYRTLVAASAISALLGGLVMYLSYRLLTALEPLDALRYGRTVFSVGKKQTREEAAREILARLDRADMKPIKITKNGSVTPVCIRGTRKLALSADPETMETFDLYSLHYLLYSTEVLDKREWERIRQDAASRISVMRAKNQQDKKKISTVAAITVLADAVDAEIARTVLQPQKCTVSQVYVCAAEPASDRWYVCAEPSREPQALFDRTYHARRMHQKLTFRAFPYRHNTAYTEDYLRALEDTVNRPLGSLLRRKPLLDPIEDDRESMRDRLRFAAVPTGGARIYGDEVYLTYKGYRVTSAVLTPEEAEEELAREAEEEREDRNVSLQDMIDDAEDLPDPEPSLPPDYRGPIVVVVPAVTLEPRLKLFRKKESREICQQIRESLLSQGYESVRFLGDKGSVTDLP